jgi:hypothetical protein
MFRLYLQHWIWNYQTGYVLHPSIPRSKHGLRVADMGTGNAYVTGFFPVQADGHHISSLLHRPATTTCKSITMEALILLSEFALKTNLLGPVHGSSMPPNTFTQLAPSPALTSRPLTFRPSSGCLKT